MHTTITLPPPLSHHHHHKHHDHHHNRHQHQNPHHITTTTTCTLALLQLFQLPPLKMMSPPPPPPPRQLQLQLLSKVILSMKVDRSHTVAEKNRGQIMHTSCFKTGIRNLTRAVARVRCLQNLGAFVFFVFVFLKELIS